MSAHKQYLEHLVVVAGHAVFIGNDYTQPGADQNWLLQSFQHGEPPFYVEHIRAGVEAASQRDDTLLVFSGGQTRVDAGPRSEGQSYWLVADNANWFGSDGVRARATTEEFARDSFENLLFSICRFREWTGHLPRRLTAVGWKFKEDRFVQHCQALRFPLEDFSYLGVNNPDELAGALQGEKRTLEAFAKDPFGVGEDLASKRESRNPFLRTPAYRWTCPELRSILEFDGKNAAPKGTAFDSNEHCSLV